MANPKDPSKPREELDDGLVVEERKKTERPKLFKVVLHNDDYTTMEFVVWILMEFFNKTQTEATQIMLHVHMKGRGICGVYTREIAETKVEQVSREARDSGHPLLCTMEPEDHPAES